MDIKILKQALEVVYRKDCCKEHPNPSCQKCDAGRDSNCFIYNAYMMLYEFLDKCEKNTITKEDYELYKKLYE